jgi:hypothetical protein
MSFLCLAHTPIALPCPGEHLRACPCRWRPWMISSRPWFTPALLSATNRGA